MAVAKKFENSRQKTLKKFNLDMGTLSKRKVSKLSDVAVAKKLGVGTADLTAAFILSPIKPRSGNKFLSIYSPLMVVADPANNIALFTSAFSLATLPAVQVEFDPITAGKKHLVEFNISFSEPNKVYKFRVFQYPGGTSQDLSISGSQGIAVLINPVAGNNSYGAEIMQLNTKAENLGWAFHSITITSIS